MNSRGSSELRPSSVPLINFSRSPSPYSRKHSSSSAPSDDEEGRQTGETRQDEDDDEDEALFEHLAVARPLVGSDVSGGSRRSRRRGDQQQQGQHQRWRRWTKNGILGTVLSALLVATCLGSTFGLLLLNRLILWSKCCSDAPRVQSLTDYLCSAGVYKLEILKKYLVVVSD